MTEPVIAGNAPKVLDVEEGKSYWWCACGRSKNQPFCDGSHEGTEFSPVEFKPEASGKCAFCLCKHTGNKPRCDGSHAKLAQTTE